MYIIECLQWSGYYLLRDHDKPVIFVVQFSSCSIWKYTETSSYKTLLGVNWEKSCSSTTSGILKIVDFCKQKGRRVVSQNLMSSIKRVKQRFLKIIQTKIVAVQNYLSCTSIRILKHRLHVVSYRLDIKKWLAGNEEEKPTKQKPKERNTNSNNTDFHYLPLVTTIKGVFEQAVWSGFFFHSL